MRIIRHTILFLAALAFLFEAWLWDKLIGFWRWLTARLPVDSIRAALVTGISKLPPYAALLLFVIPPVTILPFKIAALWLIAHGHIVFGAAAFLLAKVAGMAAAAFLFELTRPKLMTLGWFARLYDLVMRGRDWAHKLADPYIKPIKAETARLKSGLKAALAGRRAGILAKIARIRERIRRRRSAD